MIKRIELKYLKGFEDYSVDWGQINLIVGGNNSGKTSLFHALQLFFWCVQQTAEEDGANVTLGKTQLPEIGAIPYFASRDLFYKQKTRAGGAPTRIFFKVEIDNVPPVEIEIYPAFSRNLMISGKELKLTKAQYAALLEHTPVFIPGTIGITPKEELYRHVAQERMVVEGRQNQVLRNLVYRISKDRALWKTFHEMLAPLFKLEDLKVPFDEATDEWLTAVYKEDGCEFDFISAGSGFLQVVNLLSFLLLHSSKVALLDEPDSHMHDDLQKLTWAMLRKLSLDRDIQLIIASHSAVFVDEAGLDNVLLIDRKFKAPLRPVDVDSLVPLLADRGLSLPPNKVINTLKSRKALFVEGKEADFESFIQVLGEQHKPGFQVRTRGLMIFETGGATRLWPFDAIEGFTKLLGVDLEYVYISDRDFLTDEDVLEREKRAKSERQMILHLSRRNRESYLLEPAIIEATITRKWNKKNKGQKFPDELTAKSIAAFILNASKELETETQAKFLAFHESKIRKAASESTKVMAALIEIFKKGYTEEVGRNRIPLKYLDAKNVLAAFRADVAKKFGISFSDREIWAEFKPMDIPSEIRVIVDAAIGLFESEKTTRRA
jgi:AAA ATPase-like protein